MALRLLEILERVAEREGAKRKAEAEKRLAMASDSRGMAEAIEESRLASVHYAQRDGYRELGQEGARVFGQGPEQVPELGEQFVEEAIREFLELRGGEAPATIQENREATDTVLFDPKSRVVLVRGERKRLPSVTEVKFLQIIARANGQQVLQEEVAARLTGLSSVAQVKKKDLGRVWTAAYSVRRVVEEDPKKPKVILTEKNSERKPAYRATVTLREFSAEITSEAIKFHFDPDNRTVLYGEKKVLLHSSTYTEALKLLVGKSGQAVSTEELASLRYAPDDPERNTRMVRFWIHEIRHFVLEPLGLDADRVLVTEKKGYRFVQPENLPSGRRTGVETKKGERQSVFTVSEVATESGLRETTIRNLMDKGLLPRRGRQLTSEGKRLVMLAKDEIRSRQKVRPSFFKKVVDRLSLKDSAEGEKAKGKRKEVPWWFIQLDYYEMACLANKILEMNKPSYQEARDRFRVVITRECLAVCESIWEQFVKSGVESKKEKPAEKVRDSLEKKLFILGRHAKDALTKERFATVQPLAEILQVMVSLPGDQKREGFIKELIYSEGEKVEQNGWSGPVVRAK